MKNQSRRRRQVGLRHSRCRNWISPKSQSSRVSVQCSLAVHIGTPWKSSPHDNCSEPRLALNLPSSSGTAHTWKVSVWLQPRLIYAWRQSGGAHTKLLTEGSTVLSWCGRSRWLRTKGNLILQEEVGLCQPPEPAAIKRRFLESRSRRPKCLPTFVNNPPSSIDHPKNQKKTAPRGGQFL
jgi:hypothetical protein